MTAWSPDEHCLLTDERHVVSGNPLKQNVCPNIKCVVQWQSKSLIYQLLGRNSLGNNGMTTLLLYIIESK